MNKNSKTNHGIVTAALLCVFFSAVPILLASASALSATSINLSNDSSNASFPNVQNVGNNVYLVWSEGSRGIFFRSSTNGGATFGTPIKISPTGGVAQFPLMTSNGSNIYVTWAQSNNNVLQIYFVASTNNGVSFSPAKIVDNTPNTTDITPVIASFGSFVYVGYNCGGASCIVSSTNNGATFSTPFQYASGPEPQVAAWGNNVYAVADSFSRTMMPVAVSHNNGATFKVTRIAGGAGAEPWISASGTNVIVAWETKGNKSVVGIATSINSGTTFSGASTLSTTTPNAWSPMTGISGNTEYVAYRTDPGSSASQEFVSVSLDAGKTFASPIAIGIAGRDNSWPVTVPTNGPIAFVAWYVKTGASSSSSWEAVAVETTNSGASWSSPIVLGRSLSESDVATAAISSNGGTLFAVWTNATSSGNNQVFFAAGN